MSRKSELFFSFTKSDFKPDELSLVENALLSTKALFDLTERQKSTAKMKARYNRGWDYTQSSDVEGHKAYRESFVFGLDGGKSDLENIWPDTFDAKHRETMMNFLTFSINLCVDWYCEATSLFAFKVSPNDFKDDIFASDLRVKAAAYFPLEELATPQVGCVEHEDYGLFTVSFSNKCSDLLAHVNGEWIEPNQEAVANLWAGGQIHAYSDKLQPTPHKVILRENTTRYSLSLFVEV